MRCGEQSGDTGVRRLNPWLRSLALFWFLAGVAQGCFLPAPIDQEDPTSDEPPRIVSQNPILGVQQLTYDNRPNYFEVTLEELNVDQELFWRLVLSYEGAQNSAAVIVTEGASERIKVDLHDPMTRLLQAIYSPCDNLQYNLEGRSGTLYVGVSDRPFLRPLNWPYKTAEIGDAFLIDEDRPVAVVSWPIEIQGENTCLEF